MLYHDASLQSLIAGGILLVGQYLFAVSNLSGGSANDRHVSCVPHALFWKYCFAASRVLGTFLPLVSHSFHAFLVNT